MFWERPAAFIFREEVKMEAAGFSETLITWYKTNWYHIPEDKFYLQPP
jgi:hypothetical protein